MLVFFESLPADEAPDDCLHPHDHVNLRDQIRLSFGLLAEISGTAELLPFALVAH